MFCPNCENERREKTRYCPGCGKKKKKGLAWLLVLFFCLILSGGAFGVFYFLPLGQETASEQTDLDIKPARQEEPSKKELSEKELTVPRKAEKKELKEEQKKELTHIIAEAQETVYTVFTPNSQGSAFLFNEKGAVVTNAHVVEGEINVSVKTVNGAEHPGKVIGYSNETDIAVIHVPELAGKRPFPIEKSEPYPAGEEVIALGSPLGLENTATMGYITGTDRNFVINTWIFKDLYQISAPISPGSSGGPLLSKSSEKIIAVNAAKHTQDTSIGFSIPVYKVAGIIQSWIDSPMSEDEIYEQFYGADGGYFFEGLWSYSYWYFEGGYYSEEDYYFDYWEYDWDDSWFEYYEQWDSEQNNGDINYDYEEEWDEEKWNNEGDYEEEWIDENWEDEWDYEEEWIDENWNDEWDYEEDWNEENWNDDWDNEEEWIDENWNDDWDYEEDWNDENWDDEYNWNSNGN